LRYLDEYLPARGSILEVGAGTGRYTLELAKRGYSVTAVDMSSILLDECSRNITKSGVEKTVHFVVADARNLDEIKEKSFDAVLLMGPLYHLVLEADRLAVIRQAFDRLGEGGIIFSAFISRFGILSDLLKDHPEWIEDQAEVISILKHGKDPHDHPHVGFRGYFAKVDEIAPLHEKVGFETLMIAGVEPVISADDESYNRLQGVQRRLWLDVFQEMSTEKSVIGQSRHLLYVGRK
jgi:SAM-dependent methyltransferase